MSLIETREKFADSILEGRFIGSVLRGTAKDIDMAQRSYMSSRGFQDRDWFDGRSFAEGDSSLYHKHLKKHRFVDMKSRTSSRGTRRKKNHPIHNAIWWGHYNNVVKELHFGYTHAVKEEMKGIKDYV